MAASNIATGTAIGARRGQSNPDRSQKRQFAHLISTIRAPHPPCRQPRHDGLRHGIYARLDAQPSPQGLYCVT